MAVEKQQPFTIVNDGFMDIEVTLNPTYGGCMLEQDGEVIFISHQDLLDLADMIREIK